MRPIVDGLQETYSNQMTFEYLDAEDNGVGQAIFEILSLPGHPSYVIFQPDGEELFRSFGIVDDAILIDEIEAVIE